MMTATITVTCPHCGNRMRASIAHVGHKGRCSACGLLVPIEAPGTDSAPSIHPTMTAGQLRAATFAPGSTNVGGWRPALAGLLATIALYLLLFLPLRNVSSLGKLFVDPGPIQYATVLVTCWGLALLVMKHRAVQHERSYAERELEFIPLEVGVQITPSNVDQFLGHLSRLPYRQRLSILGRRIQGSLEHLKSRNSVPEVQEYLSNQAQLDASGVDAGYSLLRSFIWVIPLLGFIGTVTGIGQAVAGLDLSTGGSAQLLDGLKEVTRGLAVAFDTTFVALVMAIVLLFPTEWLRKTEYAMLDRIEQFTYESLLRRMAEDTRALSAEQLPVVVRDTLNAAFQEHQKWLAQWQAQVAQLGHIVGADVEAAVGRIQERLQQADTQRLEQYAALSRMIEEVFKRLEGPVSEDRTPRWREFLDAVSSLQQDLQEGVRSAGQVAARQDQVLERLQGQSLDSSMLRLADQIAQLAKRIDATSAQSDNTSRVLPPLEPASSPSSRWWNWFTRGS